MIRTPQELNQSIREAVNQRAVVFSHLLLAATVVTHTLLVPDSPYYQKVLAVIIGTIFTILVLFRFFDFASVNSRPRTYMAVYLVVIFIGIAFISDPATPYALGSFMIVFLLNLYYGSRGAMFGIAFFAFTSIVKYVYNATEIGLSYADKLNIIATLAVFIAVGSIFINMQKVFDWDHERLGETTKKAVLEGKRLRALINNMTESVLVLDPSYKVRLYNAAALALFNTNDSLEGKTPEQFSTFKDASGTLVTLQQLFPTSSVAQSSDDVRLYYSDEDSAALSVTVTPLEATYGHEDDETGYILTMRDITREKSLEEERDDFISVISHELRTPVTVTEASISNSMIMNERGVNDEKIGKSLKVAHDQAIFLANMLNDLATFARAENDTLGRDLDTFSPGELTVQLTQDYAKEAAPKNIQLVSEVNEDTPVTIVSNRLYVHEILQNFITNAIKYSDQGTVTIKASAADGGGIRFDVSDQGIGISVSDQKKVFDKFFRSEDFHTRTRNGTGLGLYVAQKLAKIIEASFELTSEIGKGSTFSMTIPNLSSRLAEVPATAPPTPQATPVANSAT